MAMWNGSGNGAGAVGELARRTAQSVMVTALTRAITLFGVPAGLACMGWLAASFMDMKAQLDAVPGAISLVRANVDGQIKATVGALSQTDARLDGRIDALSTKVDGNDKRIDRIEGWVDRARQTVPN